MQECQQIEQSTKASFDGGVYVRVYHAGVCVFVCVCVCVHLCIRMC